MRRLTVRLGRAAILSALLSGCLLPLGSPLPAPGASRAHRAGAPAPRWRTNLHVVAGPRNLLNSGLSGLGSNLAVGFELDSRPPDRPLGFEIGLAASDHTGSVRTPASRVLRGLELVEVYAGPRLTLDLLGERIQPFVATGGTLMAVQSDGYVRSNNPSIPIFPESHTSYAVGVYAQGGVYVRLTEALNLGVSVRGVHDSNASYFGGTRGTDYLQAAVVAGVRF